MPKVVVGIAVLAVVIYFGYVQLSDAQRKAEAVRELSKMMELRTALATELENYYHKQGAYPGALKDLPLSTFKWGMEGATPKDLESFSYMSDGQTFVMRWKGDGQFEVFLGGIKGESKFSEDEAVSNTETNSGIIIPK